MINFIKCMKLGDNKTLKLELYMAKKKQESQKTI